MLQPATRLSLVDKQMYSVVFCARFDPMVIAFHLNKYIERIGTEYGDGRHLVLCVRSVHLLIKSTSLGDVGAHLIAEYRHMLR